MRNLASFRGSNLQLAFLRSCPRRVVVVTGKKTYYKCCLIFADEDEGMASRIIKLFQHVYSNSRFFCPQFDLKQGKYVLNATTEVIEERYDFLWL